MNYSQSMQANRWQVLHQSKVFLEAVAVMKSNMVTEVSWNAKLLGWLPQEAAATEEINDLSAKIT